jgi:DMSO reductase family type II enzyme chaperone
MSEDSALNLSSASARSLAYGRLAQAFTYPQGTAESLLSAVDYTEAFDPACSQLACSIRGYSYAKEVHPTALHEELLRFYHFFGVKRSPEALMPDHVAVELEFMQFLNSLEASAEEKGDDVLSIKRARRDFLERHLRGVAHGIRRSLKVTTPDCVSLVELMVQVVDADLARLHEEVGLGGDAAA